MATDSKYLDNVNSYKNSVIYNDIAAAEQENNPLKKLEEFTQKRINLRKAVSNGEVKVWNVEGAEKTNRIAAINDLYRGLLAQQTKADWTPVYNIDKLSNPSYSGYIKDPDFYEMIKHELKNWANADAKLAALENYVEKWWYPTKVFDYLTSVWDSVTNAYWVDEEALRKQTSKWWFINQEEVEAERAKNPSAYSKSDIAAATFLSNPLETSLWFANLWIKWLNAVGLSDWIRGKQYKQWDAATTDEYNQYKQWKLSEDSWVYKDPFISWLKDLSRADLYKWYDTAKSKWFKWSVEEYADYMKNLDKYITDIKVDEWQRLIDKDLIETNKAAIVADVSADVANVILWDWAMKWWEFLKFGSKWEKVLELAPDVSRAKSIWKVTKEYWKDLVKWISNLIVDTVRNTSEWLALESAKEWRLPTSSETTTTAAVTIALEALTRTPAMYNFVKGFIKDISKSTYKLPQMAYEAIQTQTPEMWSEKTSVAEGSFWLHPDKTPKSELWKMWWESSKKLKSAMRAKEQELSTARENIQWTVTVQDIIKPTDEGSAWLNEAMAKLSDMWELSIAPDKVPVFDITENWTMEIHNKDSLNAYKTKDWVALWDAIENLYNSMFQWWKMKQNAATADAFITEVENMIYKSDLSWTTRSNKLKDIFVQWAKDAKAKIRAWMDAWTRASLEKLEWEYAEMRSLEDAVDKYILGSSSGGKYLSELQNTEIWQNVWEWWDIIRIIAEKLREGKYTKKDLIAETVAYAYALWLKNPELWAKLLEEMYPSIPWIREYFLQTFRQKALSEAAEQITKKSPAVKAAADAVWWVWNTINNALDKVPLIWWTITARESMKNTDKIQNEDFWADEDLYSY